MGKLYMYLMILETLKMNIESLGSYNQCYITAYSFQALLYSSWKSTLYTIRKAMNATYYLIFL